jgi:hypothetical protein
VRVRSRLKQTALALLAIALVVGAIAWGSVLLTDKGVDCGTAWKAAHGVMVPELNAGVHVPRGADGFAITTANSHFVTYCRGQGRLRLAESGVMAAAGRCDRGRSVRVATAASGSRRGDRLTERSEIGSRIRASIASVITWLG